MQQYVPLSPAQVRETHGGLWRREENVSGR